MFCDIEIPPPPPGAHLAAAFVVLNPSESRRLIAKATVALPAVRGEYAPLVAADSQRAEAGREYPAGARHRRCGCVHRAQHELVCAVLSLLPGLLA